MQKPIQIFAPLFVLLFLLAGYTAGFIQEIIFHEKINENGNYFAFRSSIPDTEVIGQLGPFSKICYRGEWRIYGERNFLSYLGPRGINSRSGNLTCYNGPINFRSVRRHLASETEEAALSLYRNGSASGPEILVTADELSEIEMPVASCVRSAVARWTAFEGKFFTGKSICLPDPMDTTDHYLVGYNVTRDLKLTTVGSVLKTCDPANIRLARRKYNSRVEGTD